MGYPSPKDIYGTLKFEKMTYNLKNRKLNKEMKTQLQQFIKKEDIKYMPIYPHIPKNPFIGYEIIDNKLYITTINFNNKSYKAMDIFGKEKVACNFDIILEGVTSIDEYMSGSRSVYKFDIKYFNFINGELKTITDKQIIAQSIVRKLISYVEDGARGLVGVFWLDKNTNKIYDFRQELENAKEKQNSNTIKIQLSDQEILDYLKSQYKGLGDNVKLDKGKVIYDVKNDEFIVYANKKIDKDLVMKRFRLNNETVRFEDKHSKRR